MSERPKPVATPKNEERRPEDGLFNGTRKLIRPKLPANFIPKPAPRPAELMHHTLIPPEMLENQNPEVQYFSKQIQQNTEMTVVLFDGEQLTGVIEWFDSTAFKMRLASRESVLLYKSAVKYLFKTAEQPQSAPNPQYG